ncbi:hypothetical protein NI462_08555 [Acinetobacter lwoffii]|uniref:hypothetical protein n=1 Tax=Acinetobacter lwoffii TaxID=28090 RepID=UPI00209B6E1B|nr:hypothetical protein [Acinetobacter lwoffii]MCO8097224.1 hypothetical protein [Acinetobacter lwoffii]
MKKILLITSCSKNSNGAGTLFLKNVFAGYDYEWVDTNDIVNIKSYFLMRFFSKKLEFFEKNAKIINEYFLKLDLNNYDRVVVTLSDLNLIFFASKIPEFKKVRFIIWDDYRYIAVNHKLAKTDRSYLDKAFKKILNNAKCVSVMGHNMANEYKLDENKYTILRSPINSDLMKEKNVGQRGSLNFVFCGSLYAKSEWNNFIRVLQKYNFNINGVYINVHYIGNYPKMNVISKKNIVYHSFKTGKELEKIMQLMDVGYLPYWLDEKHEIASKTSFPSKLSVYLENGLIVFNHSPKESEVSNINNIYSIGVSCNSLNENEIYNCLEKIVVMSTTRSQHFANVKNFINKELSDSIMLENLDKLLR